MRSSLATSISGCREKKSVICGIPEFSALRPQENQGTSSVGHQKSLLKKSNEIPPAKSKSSIAMTLTYLIKKPNFSSKT